jgi:hypothetical protein
VDQHPVAKPQVQQRDLETLEAPIALEDDNPVDGSP